MIQYITAHLALCVHTHGQLRAASYWLSPMAGLTVGHRALAATSRLVK